MGSAPAVRAGRVAIFAALVLTLSATGHVLVTGEALPVTTLAWAAAAVLLVAGPLSGRERSFAQIAAVLVPLELALTAGFNVGQATCDAGPYAPGRTGGLPTLLLCGGSPLHHAFPYVGSGFIGSPVLPAPSGGELLLLLAAHLLAALTCAAWLRQGEAAVFRALRAVGAYVADGAAQLRVALGLLLCPAEAVHNAAGPALTPAPRRSEPGPQEVLRRTAERRGPPAALALAA
jgi:hypothetical protein